MQQDVSLPRNPIIAKLFRVVKLAENAGYGFDKMVSEWVQYTGLSPEFTQEMDFTAATFYLKGKDTDRFQKGGQKGGLTARQVEVLELIRRECRVFSPGCVQDRQEDAFNMKARTSMRNQMIKSMTGLLVASICLISCDKTLPERSSETGKDLVLTAVEQQKADTDNQFAFDLFKGATTGLPDDENALLSPLSVGVALAMTNNGAVGETRAAIEKALRFDGFDTPSINAYYRKLLTDLPALDPKTTLNIANSIWYRQEFEVLPTFLDINRKFYEAEVTGLDFADPKAPDIINEWVSNKTREKIPEIVDNISPEMVMYLINAVYFKGQWEERFDESATREGAFTRPDGSVLQTDFMRVTHSFNVASTEGIEAIELPYGNKKYSMVVLKPSEASSPAQVVEKLVSTDAWQAITAALQPRTTEFAFPRFKFSYANTLNNELADMGMGIAFSDQADFSGINGAGDLTITEVKHKTFIEVNEEGTEAAAATSVEGAVTSMPQVYHLRIDRPFVFVIREMNTGLILFIGQVNDPSVTTSGE